MNLRPGRTLGHQPNPFIEATRKLKLGEIMWIVWSKSFNQRQSQNQNSGPLLLKFNDSSTIPGCLLKYTSAKITIQTGHVFLVTIS